MVEGVAATATAGLGIVARLVLHYAPSPKGELQPTPNLDVEDGGKALGQASGQAGADASKGPFKK